jgi:signal transduction histidine kinase/HAMP domain-containing protein
MSFKRRLSFSIVGLVLILTVVLSMVYLRHLLRMQLQSAFQQAQMVAQQVESATMDTLSGPPPLATPEQSAAYWRQAVREDDELREILLRSLASFNTIAEIAVTDQYGEVLSGSMERHQWVRRPKFKELAEKGFIEQLRAVYAPHQDYEISRTFGYEGRPVLELHVAVPTAFLWGELKPQIRELGIAALLSLLAALVLAVVFSRIAFRPLDRLGQAIDRMTRGEFAPSLPADQPQRNEYTAITSKLSLLGQQFRDAREGISSLRGNMQQLMRKLEGAVLLFDANDHLIIASAATEPFLGQGRWQMMGQSIEEVFPAGSELGALVVSAVQLRQPLEGRVVEIPNEPRPSLRVLLSVELMEDFATRRRLGTLVLLRDADTRRQIETQVEVSSRLAAISRLTGGVAHHIKNPLNAITLHLELLKNRLSASSDQPPPPELEVIAREMNRLDHVVKTFLDFNRPVDLKLAEVSLDGLVQEVAALAGPDATSRKVRIEVLNGAADSAITIKADRDQLKEAVLNLVVNAIQAMPQGGELKLAVVRLGSEVELSVADQGVGIAPQDREKIFRLYFTTKKDGSGIGLASTFRVVQLHNGTIDFSSELGRGTTFRVRFPAVEAR